MQFGHTAVGERDLGLGLIAGRTLSNHAWIYWRTRRWQHHIIPAWHAPAKRQDACFVRQHGDPPGSTCAARRPQAARTRRACRFVAQLQEQQGARDRCGGVQRHPYGTSAARLRACRQSLAVYYTSLVQQNCARALNRDTLMSRFSALVRMHLRPARVHDSAGRVTAAVGMREELDLPQRPPSTGGARGFSRARS